MLVRFYEYSFLHNLTLNTWINWLLKNLSLNFLYIARALDAGVGLCESIVNGPHNSSFWLVVFFNNGLFLFQKLCFFAAVCFPMLHLIFKNYIYSQLSMVKIMTNSRLSLKVHSEDKACSTAHMLQTNLSWIVFLCPYTSWNMYASKLSSKGELLQARKLIPRLKEGCIDVLYRCGS